MRAGHEGGARATGGQRRILTPPGPLKKVHISNIDRMVYLCYHAK